MGDLRIRNEDINEILKETHKRDKFVAKFGIEEGKDTNGY